MKNKIKLDWLFGGILFLMAGMMFSILNYESLLDDPFNPILIFLLIGSIIIYALGLIFIIYALKNEKKYNDDYLGGN